MARTRRAAREGGLHLRGEMLTGTGEGRRGMGAPCGTQPASFHQLSGSPLTSQPVLDVDMWALTQARTVWAMGTYAVQSAVDPSMHLEYFQKLSMSKLYLMESMHSK